MAYIKTTWKNKIVERPKTFRQQQNADGTVTLIPSEGDIIEPGTPVNAQNMNKIEDALSSTDKKIDDFIATKGKTNGLATLDANGRLPSNNIPMVKNQIARNREGVVLMDDTPIYSKIENTGWVNLSTKPTIIVTTSMDLTNISFLRFNFELYRSRVPGVWSKLIINDEIITTLQSQGTNGYYQLSTLTTDYIEYSGQCVVAITVGTYDEENSVQTRNFKLYREKRIM